MEALGAAASVLAIVAIVGRVSASATSFMRDVKDSRIDMIQVRKDMSELSTVLGMLGEDLNYVGQGHSSRRLGDTPHSQEHIVGIALSCRNILIDIDAVLQEGRSRIRWVTSGKERVDRLRARLETYKLSLDVALDCRIMVVMHDIKEGSTRIAGDVSAIQRDIALLIGKVDDIGRRPTDDAEENHGGVMLERFLNECRSDAVTVLDNIEYQQDFDFEDSPPWRYQAETPESGLNMAQGSPSATIVFENSMGYQREIPLEQCKTWAHMEEIIKRSYPHDSADTKSIHAGQYTLCHDGHATPPTSWGDFVRPGLSIVLKVQEPDPIEYDPIKFKDAVGRKFTLPWNMVNTWKGMEEEIIKQAFIHVEIIGPEVQVGRYDLIGPDGEIILPLLWEHTTKPGTNISMRRWPEEGSIRKASAEHMLRIVAQPPPAPELVPQHPVAKYEPREPTQVVPSRQPRQKQATSPDLSPPRHHEEHRRHRRHQDPGRFTAVDSRKSGQKPN